MRAILKKYAIILLAVLISHLCVANMASPVQQGTLSSAAFSSSDIDILNEKILITVDQDFKTASYLVEYLIKTEIDGNQIPLLFHAMDYKGDFKVWVDNEEVKIINVPQEYLSASHSPFEKFSGSFDSPEQQGEPETVTIYWDDHSGFIYNLNELKYFETHLTKGEHTIRVEYTANVWTDVSNWIKEYSFRYSLSPAKHWKSFGTLEITLDARGFQGQLTTNIAPSATGQIESVTTWTFGKLPADYIQINYVPAVSSLIKIIIAIGPIGLTIIFGVILALLHLVFVLKFRKNNPSVKSSWVVIAGSIIVPLLILCFYIYSFGFIDDLIGEEAGRYHVYSFLILLFYPVFMPLYWLAMWLFEKIARRKEGHE